MRGKRAPTRRPILIGSLVVLSFSLLLQEGDAVDTTRTAISLYRGGELLATFFEVEGLGSETKVVENGGTGAQVTQKSPGTLTIPELVLRQAVLYADSSLQKLADWRAQVSTDPDGARNAAVMIELTGKQVAASWTLIHAWPST